MLIVCPNCSSQYDVPDIRMRPNLRLRCCQCATVWTHTDDPAATGDTADAPLPADVTPAPAPATATTEPAQREDSAAAIAAHATDHPVPSFLAPGPRLAPDRHPAEPRRSPALVAAWIVTLLVLSGGGWAAVHWRNPIMESWPPATRAYAALGLLQRPSQPSF